MGLGKTVVCVPGKIVFNYKLYHMPELLPWADTNGWLFKKNLELNCNTPSVYYI